MLLDNNEIRSIVEQLKIEILPVGCILIFSSEKVPEDFLPCDGRELSKIKYPQLYALIKDTWGDTKDTFFLPDLQGQFIRGWDKDGDEDPERKFGSFQDDAFQGHGHKAEGEISNSGSHRHKTYHDDTSFKAGTNTFSADNSFSKYTPYGEDDYNEHKNKSYYSFRIAETETCGLHSHSINKLDVTDATNSQFGKVKVATETRPKNVALMFCIKVK